MYCMVDVYVCRHAYESSVGNLPWLKNYWSQIHFFYFFFLFPWFPSFLLQDKKNSEEDPVIKQARLELEIENKIAQEKLKSQTWKKKIFSPSLWNENVNLQNSMEHFPIHNIFWFYLYRVENTRDGFTWWVQVWNGDIANRIDVMQKEQLEKKMYSCMKWERK